jgi:virginiamycin A acetyltransferase
LTAARTEPSEERYGKFHLGRDLKLKNNISIEERSALYRFPYTPLIGGEKYCGLCSIGLLSYSYSAIPDPVSIGRYCSISDGLSFLDSHHPLGGVTTSVLGFRPRNPLCSDITTRKTVRETSWHARDRKPWPVIKHDVWIGNNVILALGITIGTGSVIASGSIVTKDVEPFSIVAGNPARHKKFRLEDAGLRAALLASKWWEYHPSDVERLGIGMPIDFLKNLESKVSLGQIKTYHPTTYHITADSYERVEGAYQE